MPEDNADTIRTYIKLSKRVVPAFDAIVEESGQSQVEWLTRVAEWFVQQDPEFRRAVWAKDPDAANILIRQQLTKAVDPNGVAADMDEAARTARLMIDRMEHIGKTFENQVRRQVDKKDKARKG